MDAHLHNDLICILENFVWTSFNEMDTDRRLLLCSTTLLLGPKRSVEALDRRVTKTDGGDARHLLTTWQRRPIYSQRLDRIELDSKDGQ